ncbi:hypothetical protein HDU98_011899, partial [Podochytrium sp. JEL0797]
MMASSTIALSSPAAESSVLCSMQDAALHRTLVAEFEDGLRKLDAEQDDSLQLEGEQDEASQRELDAESALVYDQSDLASLITALTLAHREIESLQTRVQTMQSSFDDAVHTEVLELEQELEVEYEAKLEEYKREFVRAFLEEQGRVEKGQQQMQPMPQISQIQMQQMRRGSGTGSGISARSDAGGSIGVRDDEKNGSDDTTVNQWRQQQQQQQQPCETGEINTTEDDSITIMMRGGESMMRRRESETSATAAAAHQTVLLLRNQLASLESHRHELECENVGLRDEVERLNREMEESMGRETQQSNELQHVLHLLSQSTQEHTLLHQVLVQEKAKTAHNDAEFRLFGAKMRGLQDALSELRTENDALRVELRKLQYEGNAASTEKDAYYKAKVDQLKLDNESLCAVIDSLSSNQRHVPASTTPHSSRTTNGQPPSPTAYPPFTNPHASHSPHHIAPPHQQQHRTSTTPLQHRTTTTVTAMSAPVVRKHSMPDFRHTSNNIFPGAVESASSARGGNSSATTTPSTTPVKTAWQQQRPPSSVGSLNVGDRDRFLDKLRRYEEESEEEEEGGDSEMISSARMFGRSVGSSGMRPPDVGPPRSMRNWNEGASPMGGQWREEGGRAGGVPVMAVARESGMREEGGEYGVVKGEMDERLKGLMERKAALTSELQKIPINSGSSRRRKEQLDDELDVVEKSIGG